MTTTKGNATVTYKAGPSGEGRAAQNWRSAGFEPADHLYVEFPAKLLPEVAMIITTFRGQRRGLMLTMTPDDATDDVMCGAELARAAISKAHRPREVIMRSEAIVRFAGWRKHQGRRPSA